MKGRFLKKSKSGVPAKVGAFWGACSGSDRFKGLGSLKTLKEVQQSLV